jgi:hypothetical protein
MRLFYEVRLVFDSISNSIVDFPMIFDQTRFRSIFYLDCLSSLIHNELNIDAFTRTCFGDEHLLSGAHGYNWSYEVIDQAWHEKGEQQPNENKRQHERQDTWHGSHSTIFIQSLANIFQSLVFGSNPYDGSLQWPNRPIANIHW